MGAAVATPVPQLYDPAGGELTRAPFDHAGRRVRRPAADYMSDDDDRRENERLRRARAASVRTALILAAIALGLYLAFFWAHLAR